MSHINFDQAVTQIQKVLVRRRIWRGNQNTHDAPNNEKKNGATNHAGERSLSQISNDRADDCKNAAQFGKLNIALAHYVGPCQPF